MVLKKMGGFAGHGLPSVPKVGCSKGGGPDLLEWPQKMITTAMRSTPYCSHHVKNFIKVCLAGLGSSSLEPRLPQRLDDTV